MASGPENRFIKSVNSKLKGIYFEKMHNPYRGGTPDVWYSGKRDTWIEYKWINSVPKKGVLIPDLSGLQKLWLDRRFSEGRDVLVVVGCPLGAIIFSDPAEWNDGIAVELVTPVILSKPGYVAWLTRHIGVINGSDGQVKKDSTKCDKRI